MKAIKANIDQFHLFGALAYAFLIPFHQKAATLALIGWLLVSIIRADRKKVDQNISLLLLPLLYLITAISLMTSENRPIGLLVHKLSFLAFPLIFYLHRYGVRDKLYILKAFVLGVFAATVCCLIFALFRSVHLGTGGWLFIPNIEEGRGFFESSIYGGNYFFGSALSVWHQTVYFAAYICTAMAVLLFENRVFRDKYRFVLITFFMVMLFFVSNKASFILITVVFLIRLGTLEISLVKKASLLILLLAILGVVFQFNPRFRVSIGKLANSAIDIDPNARYGHEIRLLNWDAAISLIKEEPILGYGVGDAQNSLNKSYKKKGYGEPLVRLHNAHNQFLQSWLESGIIGFLLIMTIFGIALWRVFQEKRQQGLLLSIFAIIFISALFESIFNRFSGISFFSFLTCLFFFGSSAKKQGIET